MAKTTEKTEPAKPVKLPSLIDQVEQIKDGLKNLIRDLSTLAESAKQMEKDQRLTEKEVEAARTTLKKLQQVSI